MDTPKTLTVRGDDGREDTFECRRDGWYWLCEPPANVWQAVPHPMDYLLSEDARLRERVAEAEREGEQALKDAGALMRANTDLQARLAASEARFADAIAETGKYRDAYHDTKAECDHMRNEYETERRGRLNALGSLAASEADFANLTKAYSKLAGELGSDRR